jgi:dipeptidase E
VQILLLSTSTVHSSGYLEYARPAISEFIGERRLVHFAPYALADLDGYTERVRVALAPLGVSVVGVHACGEPAGAIASAEVLFVGGGNTFRLLRAFQRLDLLEIVRRRVQSGTLLYLGSSAGSNLACPTIGTTNDMPIVETSGLAALGLIPFQVNAHYIDPQPGSTHMGETREQRLVEFLEENDMPVLGLREGAYLRGQGRQIRLEGNPGARLFRRGSPPTEHMPGSDLSWLLEVSPSSDQTSSRSS